METLNATHLFKAKEAIWPASSESFWTGAFSMFVLHLGAQRERRDQLTIWHPTADIPGKYFAPRPKRPGLFLDGVTIDSICVEPRAFSKPWPGTKLELTAADGGFSPDIAARVPGERGGDHFLIIENKVTDGDCLRPNQMTNYPKLADWLISKGISFDFLLLQSTGSHDQLYKQAKSFQGMAWGEHFGIVLWEEALRLMHESGFAKGILPLDAWQKFTASIETECAR